MRAVVQRVSEACVEVGDEVIAHIGRGLLVLAGSEQGDGPGDVDYIVRKCLSLRIFEDADGKMNLSAEDLGLSVLVVSQFTLLGDARHGRRPSFSRAGPVEEARAVYEMLTHAFSQCGLPVSFGQFQANMDVRLTNSGPVTILLDSRKEF